MMSEEVQLAPAPAAMPRDPWAKAHAAEVCESDGRPSRAGGLCHTSLLHVLLETASCENATQFLVTIGSHSSCPTGEGK